MANSIFQIQGAKEEAIRLAIENGMALLRRDLEIHGMTADGSTVLIYKGLDYKEFDTIWHSALEVLRTMRFPERNQ